MTYDVHLVDERSRPAAVVHARVRPDGIADFVGGAFAEVMAVLEHQHLAPTGPRSAASP